MFLILFLLFKDYYNNSLNIMTSSYRLGDLVILSNLTDNEKNQLCLDHPTSIGYDYIKLNLRTILFSNDIENNIKHITEIVLNFIKNNFELFPENIEDSIVIHTRIGDVVAGINSFEIEKRPFDIPYLKSILKSTNFKIEFKLDPTKYENSIHYFKILNFYVLQKFYPFF